MTPRSLSPAVSRTILPVAPKSRRWTPLAGYAVAAIGSLAIWIGLATLIFRVSA